MGWLKLFSVFYFFIKILNWCGMEKEMSRRTQWILGGICLALMLVAMYADHVAGQ